MAESEPAHEQETQPVNVSHAVRELISKLEMLGCAYEVWSSSGSRSATTVLVESGIYIFYDDGRTNFTERQTLQP